MLGLLGDTRGIHIPYTEEGGGEGDTAVLAICSTCLLT